MTSAGRLAAVFAVASVLAAPVAQGADPGGDAADATSPIATLNGALAGLDHAGGGFDAKAAALAPAVDGALDLATILRNSVGLGWASIPPAQQQRLLAVFRRFTLASYVSNFAGTGDRFAVVPPSRRIGTDVVVQSSIVPPSGSSTRIDYVMHQTPGGWRATDVLADGTISQVAVQRSDFRSVMDNGGAGALIDRLGKKVTSLSDGQMQP